MSEQEKNLEEAQEVTFDESQEVTPDNDPCEGCSSQDECSDEEKAAHRARVLGKSDSQEDEDLLENMLERLFGGFLKSKENPVRITVTDEVTGEVRMDKVTESLVAITDENALTYIKKSEIPKVVRGYLSVALGDNPLIYAGFLAGILCVMADEITKIDPAIPLAMSAAHFEATKGQVVSVDRFIEIMYEQKKAYTVNGAPWVYDSTHGTQEDRGETPLRESAEEVLKMMQFGPESRNQA